MGPALIAALPAITAAASVAAAGIAAYGAYEQGQQAKKAADFNAQIASNAAKADMEQAQAQAEQDKRQAVLRLGMIRANAGASGVTSSGSVLDVLGDVATQSKLQQQTDIYQGGLRASANRNTAISQSVSGAAAARAGVVSAGANLIGGAADAASRYQVLSRGSTSAGSSLSAGYN